MFGGGYIISTKNTDLKQALSELCVPWVDQYTGGGEGGKKKEKNTCNQAGCVCTPTLCSVDAKTSCSTGEGFSKL